MTLLVFSLLLIDNIYFPAKRYFFQKIKDKIRLIKNPIKNNKKLISILEMWRN